MTYAAGRREALLDALEDVYRGQWAGMGLLVDALADPDIRWRRAAYHALRQAAERSFGYDPEAGSTARAAAAAAWRDWWVATEGRLITPSAAGPGGRR
jgi:hypothetical protein